MQTTAILVAAGPGTRLGAGEPKAFVALNGTPLLVHSLRALLAAPAISAAVVVVPPAERHRAAALLEHHGPWRITVALVDGGAERQDSVRAGLQAAPDADLVVIHDAARPFIATAVIERAIAAATAHGAAVVAVPSTDTVKRVSADGWVEDTLPRERIWLAQTPQVFRAAVIRAAHAASSGPATDDAVLVERLGRRVHVVPGEPSNRKITTPEDLRWAEWWLSSDQAPR